MKRHPVLFLAFISSVAMAAPGEEFYEGPEPYLEFGVGSVNHNEKDFGADLEGGVALDFALGVNSRRSSRFSHGVKLALDNIVDAKASCDVPGCTDEDDDFHITSLTANYDLDWRFVRPVSLLFSIGGGPSWSSVFVDNHELMVRSSLGLGFHVTDGFQVTLAGTGNFFPVMDDDAEYSVIRGMLGLRWAWE